MFIVLPWKGDEWPFGKVRSTRVATLVWTQLYIGIMGSWMLSPCWLWSGYSESRSVNLGGCFTIRSSLSDRIVLMFVQEVWLAKQRAIANLFHDWWIVWRITTINGSLVPRDCFVLSKKTVAACLSKYVFIKQKYLWNWLHMKLEPTKYGVRVFKFEHDFYLIELKTGQSNVDHSKVDIDSL